MQVSFRLSPAGQAFRRHPPTIPLIVIGALKAGGSGKTSVTLALAQTFSNRGLKVAILAYRIGKGKRNGGKDDDDDGILQEVKPGEDWRRSSDEAVLLQQESGCRVFVTRHRALAWMRLHSPRIYQDRPFDLILSDDGFQDPRLQGAMRILLQAPGERPGIFDLLPGGRYRQTWGGGKDADLVLVGPSTNLEEVTCVLQKVPVHRFHRELSLPRDYALSQPWIVYCALGDNESFLRELAKFGFHPQVVLHGRNHSNPNLIEINAAILQQPGSRILCTQKDAIKLEDLIKGAGRSSSLGITYISQRIILEPETIEKVEAHRVGFTNRILVHYDK